MDIKITVPEEGQYPYLAIHQSAETNFAKGKSFLKEDIVVISKLKDGEIIVTPIIGNKASWETQYEHEYEPLPVGTKVEITQ